MLAFLLLGQTGQQAKIMEVSTKFTEHSDQIQEVCKVLRHISATEPLAVWTEHAEQTIKMLGPEVILIS